MQKEFVNDKQFPIASVSRRDLEDAGFDVSDIDDDAMDSLASDLGNAYREQIYWIDLPILAEALDIKKRV